MQARIWSVEGASSIVHVAVGPTCHSQVIPEQHAPCCCDEAGHDDLESNAALVVTSPGRSTSCSMSKRKVSGWHRIAGDVRKNLGSPICFAKQVVQCLPGFRAVALLALLWFGTEVFCMLVT